MAPAVSPDLKFTMDSIERKVDMSLDDIIKISKQKKPRRAPIKNRNRTSFIQDRRELLPGFVAARSSLVRQGKLADARARSGNPKFLATKAAARQAMSAYVNPSVRRRNRQSIQATTRPFIAAVRNAKISVPNRASKNGANRRPRMRWTSSAEKRTVAPTQRSTWGGNKMVVNGPGKKLQTLDSRFATLREQRQLQSQYGPQIAWRR